MTSAEFVVWMKGFMAACNDFTATPKQWDKIKEVLENVQDYNDNPGLDDWDDWYVGKEDESLNLTGSASANGVLNIGDPSTSTTRWNSKDTSWHYTNSTIEGTNKKQQLND